MKRLTRTYLLICTSISLTACGIGGFWMNGDPSEGRNVKPYLYYWEKPDMTAQGRKEDWVECGGKSNGNWGPSIKMTNEEKRPNENGTDAAYERLHNEFQRCILKKGYYYTGKCDNKKMRAQPACWAR